MKRAWDGICVVCGHDYYNDCHGNCTCLSCNAQRQHDESTAAKWLRAIPSERRSAASRANGRRGGRPRITYCIIRYDADGVQSMDADHIIANKLTHAEAKKQADHGYGSWTDEEGRICYHESDRPGCGGYCVEREGGRPRKERGK